MEQNNLALGIPNFTYADLYNAARLKELLDVFDVSVKHHDVELYEKFAAYRQNQGEGLKPEEISDLLVNMGPYVGQFVAKLFNVSEQHQAQSVKIKDEIDTIFNYKNEVVEKLGVVFKGQDTSDWAISSILNRFDLLIEAGFAEANQDDDSEHRVARVGAVIGLLSSHYKLLAKGKPSDYENADEQVSALRAKLAAHELAATEFSDIINASDAAEFISGLMDVVQRWSFVAQEDNDVVADWLSFKFPEKRDFDHLVEHDTVDRGEFTAWMGNLEHRRRRDGFKLTDPRMNQRQVLSEVNHCIYCHERDTDSCSKGMRNKKTNTFKIDPLGVTTIGCPLDEKISEMHLVKRNGDNIGALAIIIIDNPMCPGTGHRICNECMKGCIYQKTDPVDIPQIETNVLTDVLFMPYGFEIYSLLTRCEILVLPGGNAPGAIRKDPAAVEIAGFFFEENKPVFAICHGPQLLITARLLKGRHATCYKSVAPEMKEAGALYEDREVVVDGNLVTSRQPSDLPAFMREMMKMIKRR